MTKSPMRFPWLATLACALLLAGPAQAREKDQFSDMPPRVLQCMEQYLAPETMDAVRAGKVPKERSLRKAIRKAYDACAPATGEAAQGAAGETGGPASYDGPLFDAMSQIDDSVDMDAAMERVRAAGVAKLALFARSFKELHQNEQAVLDLAKRNPDLVVLGAPKFFQLAGDLSDSYIKATVNSIAKHGYRFIGELLYTHGDKRSGKQYDAGERYVDPSRPGTARLLEAIAPLHVPLMAHWEPYEPERDFPKLHALYSAWPDQVFLLPHMGFASVRQVDEFLGRHPNLYALSSKKHKLMNDFSDPEKQGRIGSAMLDGRRLRPEWRELLVKYQDRVLFATDPHMKKLWNKYGDVVADHRLILGQLPRDAAEKIAYRNAEKLYGVAIDAK